MSNHPNDPSGLLALADRIEEADGAPMMVDPMVARDLRLMYAAAVKQIHYEISSDRLGVAEQRILALEQRTEKLENLRISDAWSKIE